MFHGSAEGESFWSSGVDPPAWIRVDFDELRAVQEVRFTVFQNPPSDTVHVMEVLVDGAWVEMERFEDLTTTGDVLVWVPDQPMDAIEAFRMTTTECVVAGVV